MRMIGCMHVDKSADKYIKLIIFSFFYENYEDADPFATVVPMQGPHASPRPLVTPPSPAMDVAELMPAPRLVIRRR